MQRSSKNCLFWICPLPNRLLGLASCGTTCVNHVFLNALLIETFCAKNANFLLPCLSIPCRLSHVPSITSVLFHFTTPLSRSSANSIPPKKFLVRPRCHHSTLGPLLFRHRRSLSLLPSHFSLHSTSHHTPFFSLCLHFTPLHSPITSFQ